jgi:hypothetical protein
MERSPHSSFGHGVDWNPAEKLQFLAADIHAFHQRVEIGRISSAVHLDLEHALIGRVFVAIDGVADHPQVVAQLVLALPGNRVLCNRKRAIPTRMIIMAVATINSISENPRCERRSNRTAVL